MAILGPFPNPGRRRPRMAPRTTSRPMLVLYQRDDCHLCDLALEVLARARAPEFESVFLDDETSLEADYGHRVPVLRDTRDGRELDWPFDADRVGRWLAAAG